MAIIAVAYFASTGFVSLSLGILFSDFLWSYLLGTFLQASAITMALVSVNVLFFEPLQPGKKPGKTQKKGRAFKKHGSNEYIFP